MQGTITVVSPSGYNNSQQKQIQRPGLLGKSAGLSTYMLTLANQSHGLEKAEKLSRMVRSGMVTVNNVVISDPRVPFGGVLWNS